MPEFTEPEIWPRNSPDLNVIDYSVWGHCSRWRIVIRHKISDTDQLKQVLIGSWAQWSQDTLNRAIDQLPKRLTIVIKARDAKIVFSWKSIIVCLKSIFFDYQIPWRHDDPLCQALPWSLECLEEEDRSQTDRPAVAMHGLPSPNDDVNRNSISVEWYGITEGSRHPWTTQQYLDKTDNADRCGIVVTS